MKHNYYIILLLLIIRVSTSFAQQATYTLTQPDNVSKSYIARDYIQVRQGYSFNSADGKTLKLRIDNHLVVPASYQSAAQQPNSNRTLNTSYAVGTIAGSAAVTPTGAATYQIPIEVMPGTGGMQPNVSVHYNSQSGNGLLGYGWNLGTVSAITRTGKTIYHDGAVAAPNLTTADNLTLDEQRLMKASGTNLAVNSTYKTEIETYQTITCKSIGGYVGFEVKNKEGWTMEYGSSADSYIKPAGSSTAYAWLLKKVTDANGNYMTYTYTNNSTTGEFFLKQIDYTGNTSAGLTPYNRIEFFYEARSDKSKSYIAGKAVEQTVILKKIICSAYNETIREYQFNYLYDGFLSKLTEVVEFGQNGVRYNSTVVEWGDYAGTYAKYSSENLAPLSENKGGAFPIYADFNEDGRTDFISYPINPYDSDVATLFLAVDNYPMGVYFAKRCSIPCGAGFVDLLPADLNGDGLMDIVRVRKISDNNYRYDYFIFNGTVFSQPGDGFNSASLDAFVGDYDGNGKHEILTKAENKLYRYASSTITASGITWNVPYFSSPRRFPGATSSFHDASAIDFNGNGIQDLLIIHSKGFMIYELNGSSFALLASSGEIISSGSNEFLLGDFNGDGKTDILVRQSSSYFILFATGNTHLSLSRTDPEFKFEKKTLPNLAIAGQWFAGDFNKDGKTDIATTPFKGGYGFPLKIGLFNGNTFQFDSYNSNLITRTYGVHLQHPIPTDDYRYFHFSDFDGDGYPELSFSLYDDALIIKSFNSKQNLSVKAITNGLNNKTSFEYNPIGKAAHYGTTASIYTFPMSKFQQPLYVVTKMNSQLGNISNTEVFYYKGARLHKQGKGFLGFEEIEVTNYDQNRETTTKYGYNATYFNVFPTQQKVTTTSGTAISQTDFTNTYYTTGTPKVLFPYVSKQITTDNLTGLSKSVACTYSSTYNGNPSVITEKQGSLTTQTIYTWEAKNSTYKNRVTQQLIIHSGSGQQFSETKKFTYDAKARLTQKIDYYGTTTPVTTTYSNYDTFGNPRTVSTSASGVPNVVTKSTFDATGRFALTSTDALGYTSQATYNSKTGAVLTQTDIAGLKTTNTYDGFGRLTQTGTPAGTESYGLVWDISGNNLYKSTVTAPVGGTRTTWYNAAGLATKRSTPQFTGTIVTENEYNSKGQLTKAYLPLYGGKSSQYVGYTYDAYGRIATESNIGRSTTYSYSGLTTTVTNPNGTKRSTTLNTSGLVASSKDEGNNTVTYTYNSLGKPESITAAGATTHITYDERGGQKSLKDPNMQNPIQYEYDAYGQLTKQTNARGDVTTYTYDVAGRITQEAGKERTLNYTYVTANAGKGQVQSIKENNTTVRTYTYNSLGLPLTVTETIDATPYTTRYTYNSYGQMLTKTSPSGLKVNYTYNADGGLKALHNAANNGLIWQVNSINATGQITKSTLGNGLVRTRSYDNYHFPTQIMFKNGNTIVDQTNYGFNSTTGNLSSRNEGTPTAEYFTYDNLNRLTGITGGKTISYHSNGNINIKSDVGTYQYGSNTYQPHAVVGLTNTAPNTPAVIDNISNTSYNRVSSISRQSSSITFAYNADKQRNKMVYSEGGVPTETTYYVGNYEKIVAENGTFKEYDYIYTPDGLSAIAIETNGNNAPEYYYINTDYLGSIRAITDVEGNVYARYSYDAWGVQSEAPFSLGRITRRGYTGHEHLTEFGLINMNARMYDPVLGRFLEADPYVADGTYSQDFNRYAYARNNPFVYTDPNGEWVQLAIGAVIGGFSGWRIGKAQGAKGWDMAGYILGGAGIGALSGGAAVGVSALGGGAMLAGAAAGTVAGGGFGGLATDWDARSMLNGALAGGVGGLVGGGIAGAIGGGWGAAIGGAGGNLSSQIVGSQLNTGKVSIDWGSVAKSALFSYGIYEATSYLAYKKADLKIGGKSITYNQFKTIQAEYQRSRFYMKERGGILTNDGKVVKAPAAYRGDYEVDFSPDWTGKVASDNVLTHYHTHWDANNRLLGYNEWFEPLYTSNGPSPHDLTFAANSNHLTPIGILIDRYSLYYYNADGIINNFGSIIVRYFPHYLFLYR